MKEEIVVPSMGESITEAIVGEIIRPSGSQVALDEEILELETDKVNQVLYAPAAGVITLNVNTDDTVKIGQVLGHVDPEGAAEEPKKEEPKKEEPKKEEPKKEETKKEEPKKEEPKKEEPKKEEPKKEETQKEDPRKEAAAAESSRSGTQEFLADIKKPASKADLKPPAKGGETRKRMTKIRQVIANRLVEAQQSTAMLTTFNEVDMSTVMALREAYKEPFQEKYGVKLGFMSFFVKAAVAALKAVPEINSYIDGNEIVTRNTCDIGIAVGTERGLIVPVLRQCETLSFAEIESQILDYAVRARDGTISVDDLKGGGFTITNGGIYGSLLSTPILNPPQSGILGMHKIEKRPVVSDEEVVVRPMMYLALSYDHRVVDGKEAVTFLVNIKNTLEDPTRLLLEV